MQQHIDDAARATARPASNQPNSAVLVTSNVYERVLELVGDADRGTAFVVDSADRQYLVTARHLLGQGTAHRVTASNRFISKRLDLTLLPLGVAADVAVAPLDEPIVDAGELPLEMGFSSFVFSQDVFFLGFPFGIANAGGHPADRLAFVKRAVLSAAEYLAGVRVLYLDGHNNKGFSGGPVVGCPPGESAHKVCGVISRYRTEQVNMDEESAVFVNAGIVVATEIGLVEAAIRRYESTTPPPGR